jgi:hypothetical protein
MLKAVTYILENDATVQAAVGLNKAGDKHKVYPVVIPETEVAPYVVCRISGKTTSAKNCGYIYNVEVIAYHYSYDDVSALMEAVEDALLSESPGTVNDVQFGFAQLLNESDDFVKDHDLYSKTSTFQVHGL